MQKGGKIVRLICVIALAFVLAQGNTVGAEEGTNQEFLEKAKLSAARARADAEKAMAEAEAAIVQAEAAIAQALAKKEQAKTVKKEALEKMVAAHYYPEDISMTVPESTTTAVFSHSKHTEREKLSCVDCHPRVFIMKVGQNTVKSGQLTMDEMKKGKFCGNCHDGNKAFSVTSVDDCNQCHPQKK